MNTMKNSKTGFSLVEIIISVAILIILWVVWVTSYQWVVDKSKNSLVESHLQTLKNTFLTYSNDSKTLPYPRGNLKFYNTDGTYEHNFEDENTFWVSGYITSENIPKGYLQDTPIDPRNNQYYGYAHTKWFLGFQVSGVVVSNHEPKSKLVSNWTWVSEENKVSLPYLVKEYNGPRFITQDSTELFAYNPEERILTAKIHYFSGAITINNTLIASDQVKNYTLHQGDTLQVQTWAYADIYYSDGSVSTLWDIGESSSITLSEMRYVEENNLFTNISIALNAGSLWTKAVKLADKSEFQVETPAAVAAVRGTIFWVRKSGSMTSIVVKEGIVEVWIKAQERTKPLDTPLVTNEDGYIIVEKWEPELGVDILENAWTPSSTSSTGIIQKIPTIKRWAILQGAALTPININKPENICEEWFEKWNGECVEFEYDTQKYGTGILFYQELLKRNPTKKEAQEFWTGSWVESEKVQIRTKWYHNYLNKKERYFNPEYICDAQQSFTHDFECVENTVFKDDSRWNVHAYAPFNEDLRIHYHTWTSNEPTGSWHLSDKDSQWNIFWIYDAIKKEFTSTRINSLSWANLSYDTLGFFVKRDDNLALYQWGENKGLFIENDNTSGWNDYLKYTTPSLSWSFMIETSVRGWALKRSGTYTLWESWGVKLEKIIETWTNNLSLKWIDSNSLNITQWDFYNSLNDNDFYKVLAGVDDNQAFIKIYDKKNNLIVESSSTASSSSISSLYIGSDTSKENQWNDIIDYVKIYTK